MVRVGQITNSRLDSRLDSTFLQFFPDAIMPLSLRGVLDASTDTQSVAGTSVAATRLTLTRLAEARLKRTVTPISQLVVPGNLTQPTRLKSRLVSRLMEG